MSSLKNLLKGKKKSGNDKKSSNYRSSTGNLSTTSSKSGSQLNLAGSTDNLGYVLKEKDLSKFLKAAWQGDLNKLKQATNKKTNWNETDKQQRTALHLACAKGSKEAVEYLLSNGSITNKSDSEGKTPLMKACENNSLQIVDILLRAGAETNICDANHMTALHIAAANGNADIGQMLANRDAKLDAKDMNQVTPLHLSCALGHIGFTEFLISEYVQVNPVDNQKRTPLMTACVDGHIDIVQLLLEHEADPEMKDKGGLNAEQLATQSSNAPIATLLDTFMKKKKKVKSPPSSQHSKGSERQSPAAQVLSDLFSPVSRTSEQGGFGNIFGGPAMNTGDIGNAEKSEESNSEDLGDDSWGDTDVDESEVGKKTKGIDLAAAMMKKKEEEDNKAKVDNAKSTVEPKKSTVTKTESSPGTENSSPLLPNVNKGSNKLPWQDGVSDEETESKWDDDDDDDSDEDDDNNDESAAGTARNRNTTKQSDTKLNEHVNKEETKVKETAPKLLSIPPPPIDFDESAESVDFDSSIPDDSFGGLPLSEADGAGVSGMNSAVPKGLPIKENADKEDEDESNWDESDSAVPQQSLDKNKTQVSVPPPPVKPPSKKVGSMEDSEWDSDDSQLSDTEPTEEVLPPRTPEPGSEFEPSTSGDEDDSDFSLAESKKIDSPKALPKLLDQTSKTGEGAGGGGGGIFQTEVGDAFDSSDDEIEKQILNMSMTAGNNKTPKSKDQPLQSPAKPLTSRQKQLADLGLDLGSDVSSVSDPDDITNTNDVSDDFSLPGDAKKAAVDKTKEKGQNQQPRNPPMDLIISSDEESSELTESESDWEKQQKEKRLMDKNSNILAPVKLKSPNTTVLKDEQLGKIKGPPLTKEHEKVASPPHINQSNLSNDDDGDESSDFSFSDNDMAGGPSLNGDGEKLEDEGEDEAEAFLLKQMEVAEANVAPVSKNNDDAKDRENVVNKENKEKQEQVLKEGELKKLAEDEEDRKRKKMLQEEEDNRRKALAQEEEDNRRKALAQEEEDNRRKALAQEEEDNRRKALVQEEEDNRRKALVQEEEDNRRKALVQEEEDTRKMIQAQREENMTKLALEEETKRKELESEIAKRQKDLEQEENDRREKLDHLERDLQARIQEKEEELKHIEAEKIRQRGEIDNENTTLANVENTNAEARRRMEKEMDELNEKLEMERMKMEKVEREGKLKEEKINDHLSKLEEEETKLKLRLDESALLERSMDDRNRMMDSLEVEEIGMKEKLKQRMEEEEQERKRKISEEYKVIQLDLEKERALQLQDLNDTIEQERQKLYLELEKEESERRRKLSEEGRQFREALENEREKKLNELFSKSEDDKLQLRRELEEEAQMKLSGVDKEVEQKELIMNERVSRMEKDRLKNLEEKEKLLEEQLKQKLKKMEVDKLIEIERKEREIIARMNTEYEAKQKSENQQQKRFHELEQEARLREKELELQLMELRQKQVKNDIAPTEFIRLSAIKAAPVTIEEEILLAPISENVVEALNDSLLLEDFNDSIQQNTTKTTNNAALRNSIKKGQRNKSVDAAIQMIGSSSHNYSFDPQQHGITRSARGASTPKPVMKELYLDETDGENLYNDLRQAHYRIEGFQEKYTAQERLRRETQFEMEGMQRTIETLNQSQNAKEKSRLDTDLELQSLKYKLEQESEAKLMAERLCNQLKDQLNRSEKKLTREAELRQGMELTNRKIQSEIKSKEQEIFKLNADINELRLSLETEQDAKQLQEEMYQEQLRQHEAILREAQKTSHNHAQAVTKIEMMSESRKYVESASESLKIEFAKAKGELSRAVSQLDETQAQLDKERASSNEKLQSKIQELGEIEKKLMQVQLQYENERSNRENMESQLSTKLESETNNSKQLQVEVASLKNRLEHSNREIDRLGDQTTRVDKEARSDKENRIVEKFQMEKDLTLTQNQLKITEEKVQKLENELLHMNGELKNTGRALATHKDEAVGAQKNYHETKDNIKGLEENLRLQQLNNARFESQLESANQKSAFLSEENAKLQRELDKTKESLQSKEREYSERNERLSTTLGDVKEKTQQEKTGLLLQNEQNHLLIDKLQNQLERKEERLRESDAELRKVKQSLEVTKSDLVNVRNEKDSFEKVKENTEKENSELRQNVKQYESQLEDLEKNKERIEGDYSVTKSELDKTRQLSREANKRLALKSTDLQKLENANNELHGGLQDIKRQNLMIESDLREEKGKAEVLLQELQSANEARENLEALLSNIKGSNVVLEEKLNNESLHRSQREREAEEHKNLWESEVKSRSKLGVQMIDLEKKIEELKGQIEAERRKTRKVLEVKKTSDNKIEIYEQRSVQHQQEATALRNKLKQYQKKLKKYESGDYGIEKERQAMSTNVSKLRQQLKELSERLKREQEMRSSAEKSKHDQLTELSSLKTNEKVHRYEVEKLEGNIQSLQRELAKQKDFFEKHYIPEESLEEFKQALETKCRLDLNKKLQEVNMHLEEQALAREAFDKIRNDKEYKTRKELEDTIVDLKSELGEMRSTIHEGLARRNTSQTEAKRYRDLFESEVYNSEMLSSKLAKTCDKLSTERNRTNFSMDETLGKPKVSKQLFQESSGQAFTSQFGDDLDFGYLRRSNNYSTPQHKTRAMKSPHKDLLLSSIKRRPLNT